MQICYCASANNKNRLVMEDICINRYVYIHTDICIYRHAYEQLHHMVCIFLCAFLELYTIYANLYAIRIGFTVAIICATKKRMGCVAAELPHYIYIYVCIYSHFQTVYGWKCKFFDYNFYYTMNEIRTMYRKR